VRLKAAARYRTSIAGLRVCGPGAGKRAPASHSRVIPRRNEREQPRINALQNLMGNSYRVAAAATAVASAMLRAV
jgi:hypothetical protein